jgi:hypothetical protein
MHETTTWPWKVECDYGEVMVGDDGEVVAGARVVASYGHIEVEAWMVGSLSGSGCRAEVVRMRRMRNVARGRRQLRKMEDTVHRRKR